MKYALLTVLSLSLVSPILVGCSEEVSHHETDKPRLFGGHTHEESTTYKNADGSYTTEHSKVKTAD